MDRSILFVCVLLAVPQVVMAIDPEAGTWLGIGLNCLGSCFAATGLVLQKLTHVEDLEKEEEDRVPMYCRWKWYCGVFGLFLSGVFEGWSLAFTSLSVVAPLSGLTVVFNTILAVLILKEKTDMWETVAMILIVMGIGCTSAFGPREAADYNNQQLENMWQGCQFNHNNKGPLPHGENIAWYNNDCEYWVIMGYFGCILVLWAVNGYGIKYCQHMPRVHAISYASLAGSFGSTQQLCLKCAVELLYATLDGDSQTQYTQFYVYWLGLAVFCFGQLVFLNWGLAHHDSVSYIPLYQALLVVYSTIAGGIFFDEFGKFDVLAAVMFAVGLCLVSAGLLMFTTNWGKCQGAADDEELELEDYDAEKPPRDDEDVIAQITEVYVNPTAALDAEAKPASPRGGAFGGSSLTDKEESIPSSGNGNEGNGKCKTETGIIEI